MKRIILVLAVLLAININANGQSKISLGLNGGLSIPVSELKNVYKLAPSGELNFGYKISPEIELLFTTGYNSYNFKNEYLNDDIYQLDLKAKMNEAWTMMAIPVTAGIRYKFDPVNEKILPYGTAEIGAYFANFDKRLGGSIILTGSNITTNTSLKESQVGLGLAIGIGTFIAITPKISLDVVIKYNFVKADFVKDYTITKDTLAPLNVAGINTGMFVTTRVGINFKL